MFLVLLKKNCVTKAFELKTINWHRWWVGRLMCKSDILVYFYTCFQLNFTQHSKFSDQQPSINIWRNSNQTCNATLLRHREHGTSVLELACAEFYFRLKTLATFWIDSFYFVVPWFHRHLEAKIASEHV